MEAEPVNIKRVKTVVEEILPQIPGQPAIGVKETNNIIPQLEIKEAKSAFLKYFLITFLVTLVILALAGGIWVYMKGTRQQTPDTSLASPEPVVLPTSTPTASPNASPVALADYKISILNGSGKIGAATTAKNLLIKAEFKVLSTGNAENFSFDTTLIQVKPSVGNDIATKIKDSLSPSFKAKIGDPLDGASQFDVIVTVGLQ